MNLNGFHGENVWTPSFLRSVLTYRILRESGVSAPYSFHVHVIQNGFFYGLCAMEEQIDKRFLKRNGLAQEGSLYKAHRTGNWLARIPEGGWRKIFPENEDFSNLAGFVQGISPSNSVVEREKFIFDTKSEKWKTKFNPENYKAKNFSEEVVDAKSGKVVIKLGEKINYLNAKKLSNDGLKDILVAKESLFGKFLHKDIKLNDQEDGLLKIGTELNETIIQQILDANITSLDISVTNSINKGPYLLTTILNDKNNTKDEAITEIYKMLRPGEPPTIEIATQIFNNLFFSSDRYDLSDVGRVKMNSRLDLECSDKITILRNDDILAIIRKMLDLRDGKDDVDDIDHLGNRRVRSVGELVENQARIGVYRMERAIKEKMTTLDIESAMPQDLINAKPLTISLKDFFASSQLSQFMDQTNPLSEITHKRRVSALGPGGLTRERAGFEVRDVHPTHYGRICPIETPEGPNIGLINSLSTYAKINKYGFIESPYKRVKEGVVQDKVEYLSAMEETKFTIAQANTKIDKNGKIVEELVSCRQNLNFLLAKPETIDYIDVSPKQLVSVAASCRDCLCCCPGLVCCDLPADHP